MGLNEEQKRYIAWAAEELIRQVREFISAHDDLEPHPKVYYFYVDPDPDPKLFWNNRYAFGLQLYCNCLTPSNVCLDVKVLSLDVGYQAVRLLANGSCTDIINAVAAAELPQKIEDAIPSLIWCLDDL